ncbi:hypothetical protein DMC47_05915 [Nostoc sp. 3335mG]|nr:hypothetical protein DMC47_05915 [Nostoc sp. 3335mG]
MGQVALPEPVLKAARQILGNQLVARDGKVGADALKAAVRNSGIFQEASLAAGAPANAAADTKSGLLALRQGLTQWLGNQGQIAQVMQVPPPLRHVLARARLPEALPPALPDDLEEVGRLMLERTEGALSRLRLHQHASLPDGRVGGESEWSMDLPLSLGAQQQAILHLQIHHDAPADPDRPEDRGWQVRLAINLTQLGEVGAQVSLRGETTGIMLWAERDETADGFTAALGDLRSALEQAGLKPGALVVRRGAPSETHAHAAAASGQFLDATR